jgi:predicted MFS family arabinose efflux permease
MNLPETPIGWLALFVLMAVCGVLVMLGLSAFMDKLDGSKGDAP